MSFEPAPIATLAPQGISAAATTSARVIAAQPAATPGAVKVDTVPAGPPPEIAQAMDVASSAYDRLAAKGSQLSFQIDQRTGVVRVEVHDLKGNVLFTIPPSKALDIASGGDLDQ